VGGNYGPDLVGRPGGLVQALDPFAVTAADFDVPLVGSSGIRPWKVRLANESPYALRIDCGGFIDWLSSGTVDVWPTGGATVMHVHPVALSAPALVPASLASLLLVTVAGMGEEFPGRYPMSLGRQVAAYSTLSELDRFDTTVSSTKLYPMPGGVASVGFGVDINEATLGAPTRSVLPPTVTLRGLPSGDNYLVVAPVVSRRMYWAVFNPEDTTLAVFTDGSTRISGVFLDILTSPIVMTGQGGDQFGNMSVTLAGAQPAPWQVPNQEPFSIAAAIASGGNANIIPAIGGKVISLFSLALTVDAVGAAGSDLRFFDGDPATTGTERGRIGTNVQPPPIDFHGASLTAGNGFYLLNGGAAAITARGIVIASRA
jgi:hypothetical protein